MQHIAWQEAAVVALLLQRELEWEALFAHPFAHTNAEHAAVTGQQLPTAADLSLYEFAAVHVVLAHAADGSSMQHWPSEQVVPEQSRVLWVVLSFM